MPARSLENDGSAENVLEEDLSFLAPTINMDRKRLRGPLSADLVVSLRNAAAPFTVTSPRSVDDSDVDSDDELLMDVEVRTSGPDSGLITNKSELKDEDDDDNSEVLNLSKDEDRLLTGDAKCLQNEAFEDYTNTLSVDKLHTTEKIAFNWNENKHFGIDFESLNGKRNGFINLPSTGITETKAEFDILVARHNEVKISRKHETYSDTTDEVNRTLTNYTTINAVSNAKAFTITNDESHGTYNCTKLMELIECKSPTPQSKSRFDNSPKSNLIEAALDIASDDCTIVEHKSLDPRPTNDGIKQNGGTNGYYSGKFPKLKQMLTTGKVSDATVQFNKVMSNDNLTTQGPTVQLNNKVMSNGNSNTQGPNHLQTPGKQRDPDSYSVNDSHVSTHSNMAQGMKENNGNCLKRPSADDCNKLCKENAYLPPKKSKSLFTNFERLQYQNGFGKSSISALNSQGEHRDNNSVVENMHKPTLSQDSAAGKGVTPVCGPRPSSQRIPPPAPLLPPCRVCGEKASGFHYGVNTCEACKGFFRRSLCRKEPYVCVSDGTCEVQSGRRTVCSHCRLKRCLDVGMSKNAIKTGRYTHELRSKNIMEVKELQKLRERGTTAHIPEPDLPQIKVPDNEIKTAVTFCHELNEELQLALDKLMVAQTYLFEFLDDYYDAESILKRQMEVYNRYKKEKFDRLRNKANNLALAVERKSPPNSCVSRDYLDDVTANSAPSGPIKEHVLATTIGDMERGIQGLVMFAKNIPGFIDLHVDDQAALLKVSRFDIWYIGHIRCMNSPLRVGACEWYFHAEELEQVWGTKVVDMLFKLTDYGQKLDLTREETVALRALSLTFSDRCTLKDRMAVENIHDRQFQVFQYVASKRHPNFYKWLPDVINFLMYLREFAIEFDKKSCNMNMEWPVIQRNPLLLEVFFS